MIEVEAPAPRSRGPQARSTATATVSEDAAAVRAAAEASAPDVPDGALSDAIEARFRKMEIEYRRVWTRMNILRTRIFAVQEAFVQRMGTVVCELGDPAGELFPVEIRRSSSSQVRVIAFGSMGNNFGVQPRQFFKTFQERDAEVLFVKDYRQCWYQRGLIGVTKDVPSTAEYLRTLLNGDMRPVVTVGASSGGFAALLFGAMLGARRVVAFSPQTMVNPAVVAKFRTDDTDDNDLEFDDYWADLVRVLHDHPLVGTARVFHARRAPFDAQQAGRLEGTAGVSIEPLEWHGHNTASMLRDNGQLDAVIDELMTP